MSPHSVRARGIPDVACTLFAILKKNAVLLIGAVCAVLVSVLLALGRHTSEGAPSPVATTVTTPPDSLDASNGTTGPRFTLQGRVADSRSRPIPRANLQLVSIGGTRVATAKTNQDGSFIVSDVRTGSYLIRAEKNAFLPVYYGQATDTDAVRILEVGTRAPILPIDITMSRSGVIVGAINDAEGEPVVDGLLTAVPDAGEHTRDHTFEALIQGKLPLASSADVRTGRSDDRGVFRIYGVKPGRYRLVVTGSRDGTSVAPSYFPGTVDIRNAGLVTVTAQSEIDADIRLPNPDRQLASVRGFVLRADGSAASGASVKVVRASDGTPIADAQVVTSSAGSDGGFITSVLPNAEYFVVATNGSGWLKPGIQTDIELGRTYLRVGSVSVDPVTITMRPGAIITGKVSGAADVSNIRVIPVALGAANEAAGITASAVVNNDGTFSLHNVFGQTLLDVGSAHDGPRMTQTLWNGEDVTDVGFDLASGATASGVEVRISSSGAQLGGVVRSHGAAVRNATVLMFSQERLRLEHPQGRYIRVGKTDDMGRFDFRNIPTGEYFLVAQASVDVVTDLTADALLALAGRAIRVEVSSTRVDRDLELTDLARCRTCGGF